MLRTDRDPAAELTKQTLLPTGKFCPYANVTSPASNNIHQKIGHQSVSGESVSGV
jgi:hypothetical protein